MEVYSVFTVTNVRTGKDFVEHIEGSGQDAIRTLRKMTDKNGILLYPPYTSKIILEGFEMDGTFYPLYIRSKRRKW